MTYILLFLVSAISAALLLCFWLGRMPTDFWSISIFSGKDLRSLAPHPGVGDRPVLTATDVTDTRARFVADPFLWRSSDGWHMFFEVYSEEDKRGVISHAACTDGITWQYDRVILKELFHLSYPHVFEHEGQMYMTPETGEANEVRLYRSRQFPREWELDTVLLRGRYYDPTVLRREGRWWMWVCDERYTPLLFTAEALHGPWVPHERNVHMQPDVHTGRPGGRALQSGSEVLRFVQDSLPTYGSKLHALRVETLQTDIYAESAWLAAPILSASGEGWRATGMHHMDACQTPQGWIAAVDGNQQRVVYNWRLGARMMQRWVMELQDLLHNK